MAKRFILLNKFIYKNCIGTLLLSVNHHLNLNANNHHKSYGVDMSSIVIIQDGLWGTRRYIHDDQGVFHLYSGTFNNSMNAVDLPWFAFVNDVNEIRFEGPIQGASKSRYLFSGFKNLIKITGIELLDTSEVTDMAHMFFNDSKLESLDLSHFNTSKVTKCIICSIICET